MKVVIDTNVVVSAILRDRKPEEVILFVQQHPQFEWIASVEILAEYVNVIQRKKFNLPESIIARWMEIFGAAIRIVDVQPYNFPRDQKDAKFLACSLAVGADFLITGDGDFEAAHRIGNTEVLSVALFKSLICDAGL
jgi:putative PIN family toxin of toxin-antitoxin system